MKKFSRLFIFLMAFQMEVRVRASGDLLQSPDGCLKTKDFCSVQASQDHFHYVGKSLKLHMGKASVIQRASDDNWKLVSGYVWIEQGKTLTLDTVYATLKAPVGEYWVIDKGDRIVVRNINADLTVEFRDGKKMEVPEGFEFWVGGLNTRGVSEYGMIEPIEIKNHLSLWKSLYQGSKEDFLAAVQKQKINWGDLVEKSSQIYRQSADRQIASVERSAQLKADKERREEQQRQKVRQLFYDRTFKR
ncbi:hypothetical protein D3C87_1406660 [compost metagenome]